MKNKRTISFLIVLLFINHTNIFAQCAMCKSSVESDLANGGSIAQGLNIGILYLLTIPYIILMVGAYLFFKKPIDAKIKVWRNKYFPARESD